MVKPDVAYNHLQTTIQALETTFVSPALAVRTLSAMSKPEILHLSAYVVLSHAAFEEYFEALASWGLETAVSDWIAGNARAAATTLILHAGKVSAVDEDTPDSRSYDRVRIELDRLKTRFSGFITRENHGISVKYLKRLFYPLGVDIPANVRWMSSLETLAGLRGAAAHTSTRGAKKQLDPAATTKIVSDCLELALELKQRTLGIT